jgi:RNA-splicing ligase RtcB
MIVLNGNNRTNNYAHVFIDQLDETTREQIKKFLDCPVFDKQKVRIMPDTHAGKGSVIGFTSTFNDYVVPNVVGVDIGCGITAYNLGENDIEFEKLDSFIRKSIPFGRNVHKRINYTTYRDFSEKLFRDGSNFFCDLKETASMLRSNKSDYEYFENSLGTLGGGNHFIEIDVDSEGNKWLLIHSGSRNFGLKICNFYQEKAKNQLKIFLQENEHKDLEFLPMGYGGEEYLHSMHIAQKYAKFNRILMAKSIIKDFFGYCFEKCENIESVHNYIDIENKIIRKGAISAQKDEKLLIPINMRDGVIVGTGLGNHDWNYSAPHGAGRIYGRNEAKKTLSLEEYQKSMKGIWTSCVNHDTLDESPMAYKPIDTIVGCIKPSVDIDFIMKPIYNFKASE